MFLLLSLLSATGLSTTTLVTIFALLLGTYFVLFPQINRKWQERKWKKWSNTPKDLVIMHAIFRGRTVPHPSPFVLKLETYLRMAKIPYKADISIIDAWGPKSRFPWISINGQHLGDSQLAIEYLNKKFEVKLGHEYSKSELAIGAVVRVMVDDHLFWAIPMERFVYAPYHRLAEVMGSHLPKWVIWIYYKVLQGQVIKRSKGHGIGLNPQEEVQRLTQDDLKHLSTILGQRKFLLGEYPSEYDCTVFGHLAQAMWGLPGSSFEKAVKEEFPNLKEYCLRIKETYYPDWDEVVDK
ncbi:failed axon connections homolog [Folsomia candida]|uniref:Failed axon connections n=1 Tax=Folsomia candida TaxID=158441 RepID=A0A226DYJ2_FOLCA|nr:failed axon connections homolog [Folsomia candida]OXA50522.1 Failed axon connections [Folsomia candida]